MSNFKATWDKLERPAKVGVAASAAVGVVLAIVVIVKILPALLGATSFGLVLALLFVPYWVPTIVAFKRKHPSKGGVLALNFFLGWSFIGWVVSLVWALSDNAGKGNNQTIVINNGHAPMPVEHRVGDVVNGHRFNGTAWTPVEVTGSPAPTAQIAPVAGAPIIAGHQVKEPEQA